MLRVLCVGLLMTGFVVAQADFEIAPAACGAVSAFPAPCGAAGGPEGISWNGAPATPFAPNPDTANGVGMPTSGLQYGRVSAKGAFAVVAGGPSPEPLAGGTAQMFIPVPAAAVTVSFYWDFYNAEGGPSAAFNDGMSIDLVTGACGPAIANLVYVDTNTILGPGIDGAAPCSSGGPEVLAAGPQGVNLASIAAGSAFIRVSVWNGGDNAVSSDGVLDTVLFDTPLPPPNCVLFFSSPLGPGSIQVDNTSCPAVAGASYINAVTLAAGVFPAGWFFGLDITLADLVNQYNVGFPFTGGLDGAGSSSAGPFTGLPSGLTIWAVTAQFAPGFGTFISARPPVTYTIP